MAWIDYHDIEVGLKAVLEADTDVQAIGTKVSIEDELVPDVEMCPYVSIYLESRSAPEGEQRIRAGRSTDLEVRLSIWCWEVSFKNTEEASKLRSQLVGRVEKAVMTDRTLGGKVITCWLDGGEFVSASKDNTFLMGGEVTVVVRVQSTTG